MFLHDAEYKTVSWTARHSPEARAALGVWRWRGIADNMDRILAACVGKRVIDFGGFDGPLGLGAVVVDPLADRTQLSDVPGPVDVIFTSHTLEHVDDLQVTLRAFYEKLVPGGMLIVHVPAWTCWRWWHTNYENANQNERHKRTFALCEEATPEGLEFTAIDLEISVAGFDVTTAKHCGDDSILVFARKL